MEVGGGQNGPGPFQQYLQLKRPTDEPTNPDFISTPSFCLFYALLTRLTTDQNLSASVYMDNRTELRLSTNQHFPQYPEGK